MGMSVGYRAMGEVEDGSECNALHALEHSGSRTVGTAQWTSARGVDRRRGREQKQDMSDIKWADKSLRTANHWQSRWIENEYAIFVVLKRLNKLAHATVLKPLHDVDFTCRRRNRLRNPGHFHRAQRTQGPECVRSAICLGSTASGVLARVVLSTWPIMVVRGCITHSEPRLRVDDAKQQQACRSSCQRAA